MDSTPLKSHGQHHCFFMLHHFVIPNSLQVLWGKIVLLPQLALTEQSSPPAVLFQLCGWVPESCSLLMGHPFYLEVTKVLILWVEKRFEFPPPVRHPFILLHIGADPLTYMVLVSLNPSPGFLYLLGRVVARCGHGEWRRRGTRSISLLGGFCRLSINLLWGLCGFGDFWAFWEECGLRGI